MASVCIFNFILHKEKNIFKNRKKSVKIYLIIVFFSQKKTKVERNTAVFGFDKEGKGEGKIQITPSPK